MRVWVPDEGRFGLKPVLKRLWALQGQRPVIAQRRRYQWLYPYMCVEPLTGQSDFLIFPSVSVPLMHVALDKFSRQIEVLRQQKRDVEQAIEELTRTMDVVSGMLRNREASENPKAAREAAE